MTSLAPHYTVLRIKRKIDAVPLTSLFIEESERAKKRAKDSSHEPTPPGNRGVFVLAETVGHEWSTEGAEAQALQERIARLLIEQQPMGAQQTTAAGEAQAEPLQQAARRYRVIKPQPRSRSSIYRASQTGRASSGDSPHGSSKLGPQRMDEAEEREESIRTGAQGLRFIDAHEVRIPAVSAGPSTPTRPSGNLQRPHGNDARYQGLLAETLAHDQAIPLREPTMADRPMPHDSPRRRLAASDPAPTPLARPAQTDEEGVFVYDLYYKVVGGVADTDLGNVGALMGYEDLFDDEASDSEPEPGDEADEDSNEEDFYRNDYPEDDASSGGGDDLEEPDRETYLQPVAHRRVYKYGDDADSDRDGFASSDEEDDSPSAADGGMSKAFQKAFGLGRHSGLDSPRDGAQSGDEDDEMRGFHSDDAEEIGEVDEWQVIRDD